MPESTTGPAGAVVCTDPARIAGAIDLPLGRWPAQCAPIATACLAHGFVRGRYVFGHWVGPIAPGSYFAGRPGFVQHAFVDLGDGTVYDPTRWVFEGRAPYVYVGPNDYYDEGGNVERLRTLQPSPAFDGSRPSGLDDHLAGGLRSYVLDGMLRQPPEAWVTIRQAHWLATLPVPLLGAETARGLFAALVAAELGALIPADNRRLVLGAADAAPAAWRPPTDVALPAAGA
jgi:hypothetical protein